MSSYGVGVSAYYNEHDPGAAAWLRELIKRGLIADGEVDERSIIDVTPADVAGFTQCHFFAGIAGWSLALRDAGWPDDKPVWTGSAPCQPFSAAGRRAGVDDKRHLWPAFHWLIKQCRPERIFGEQVGSGDAIKWLDVVQDDLEGEEYTTGAVVFPACSVGAPHLRQRLYWVAKSAQQQHDRAGTAGQVRRNEYSDGGATGGATKPDSQRLDGQHALLLRDEAGREQEDMPEAVGGGEVGSLADSQRQRLEGFAGDGDDSNEPGREHAHQAGPVAESGATDSPCDSRPGQTNGRWADADWIGCTDGKWRATQSALLSIYDGVSAELVRSGAYVPASQPLCEKADNRRVMRLKGYGNAINVAQAAAFVRAAGDVLQ